MKKLIFQSILFVLVSCLVCAQERVGTPEKKPKVGTPKSIAVLGSSVAAGWVTSHAGRYDMKNGWAWRLARLLEPRGYDVKNLSVPGDDTAAVLARFDKDVAAADPDFAIIALSLSNEGLGREEPYNVLTSFESGMERIIEKCRERGITPIVGSCYPCDLYDGEHYTYLKNMNLLENSWNVPVINFLGAIDDGAGHFPEGHTYDESHPGNRGHEEMFLAVVPGLFEAIDAEKEHAPEKLLRSGFVTVAEPSRRTPLSYVPDEEIHSFALGFSFRTRERGTVAAVDVGDATASLKVAAGGQLVYRTSQGKTIASGRPVDDGAWHDVVLSHRHLQGESRVYIDGRSTFKIKERLVPRQFILGGPGPRKSTRAPSSADYRDWLVYRSSLNGEEVNALRAGTLICGSLEVYAPLDLGGRMPAPDAPVKNLAQSLSDVHAHPSDCGPALAAIESAIARAAQAREEEFVVVEKKPVRLAATQLDACCGKYDVAPGFSFEVFRKEDKLFVKAPGQPEAELLAESERKFFIRFPLAEITFTFVEDSDGKVKSLVFKAGDDETPAQKVE